MGGYDVSRREFLQGSAACSALLRGGIPGLAALSQAACGARDEGVQFDILSAAEAREIEAIAARILPTTDTPGAHEAGVVWFFDKALGGFMAPQLDFLRTGLVDFQAPISSAFHGAVRFSDLDETDQDAYLATRDQTSFFGTVRFLTLAGMFGMSSYGGNKDAVGWKLLGLDPTQHAHQPPFGYYDAEFVKEQNDGG